MLAKVLTSIMQKACQKLQLLNVQILKALQNSWQYDTLVILGTLSSEKQYQPIISRFQPLWNVDD